MAYGSWLVVPCVGIAQCYAILDGHFRIDSDVTRRDRVSARDPPDLNILGKPLFKKVTFFTLGLNPFWRFPLFWVILISFEFPKLRILLRFQIKFFKQTEEHKDWDNGERGTENQTSYHGGQ